jgi:hypothetical protein
MFVNSSGPVGQTWFAQPTWAPLWEATHVGLLGGAADPWRRTLGVRVKLSVLVLGEAPVDEVGNWQ